MIEKTNEEVRTEYNNLTRIVVDIQLLNNHLLDQHQKISVFNDDVHISYEQSMTYTTQAFGIVQELKIFADSLVKSIESALSSCADIEKKIFLAQEKLNPSSHDLSEYGSYLIDVKSSTNTIARVLNTLNSHVATIHGNYEQLGAVVSNIEKKEQERKSIREELKTIGRECEKDSLELIHKAEVIQSILKTVIDYHKQYEDLTRELSTLIREFEV
jgi:hypothetical protein